MNIFRTATSAQPKDLSKILKELRDVNLKRAKCYGTSKVNADSFKDIAKSSKRLDDPDMIRAVMYYMFQPLYDRVAEGRYDITGRNRPIALSLLDETITATMRYLTGYYTGNPDTEFFRNWIGSKEQDFYAINDVAYYKKYRNMNDGNVSPAAVLSFMRQLFETSVDGRLLTPSYITGCACGSSEIALALGGFLSVDVGFIRFSKRRGDTDTIELPEHMSARKIKSRMKNVAVVDDYVCTGKSIAMVMREAARYSPANIMGFAVHYSEDEPLPRDIGILVDNTDFHVYEMR